MIESVYKRNTKKEKSNKHKMKTTTITNEWKKQTIVCGTKMQTKQFPNRYLFIKQKRQAKKKNRRTNNDEAAAEEA